MTALKKVIHSLDGKTLLVLQASPAPDWRGNMESPGKVLGLVNRARMALGWEPAVGLPRGRPRASDGCVLSRLLGAHIECEFLWFDSEESARRVAAAWRRRVDVYEPAGAPGPRYAVRLPVSLVRFCRDFDNWRYPDLVETEIGAPTG